MAYIPFDAILSYNAPVSIVIGARGCGKTFAMRERFLKDFIRDGSRFAVIVRTDTSIPSIARDFFGLLSKPGKDGLPVSKVMREHHFRFKRVEGTMYAVEVPPDHIADPAWKPDKGSWRIIGYFASLNCAEHYKQLTYALVKRILLDEAVIEHPRPRHDYLPDEFTLFAGLVDSIGREHEGGESPKVYLLGNSGALVNPYFAAFGINDQPEAGFTWHAQKHVLLYVHRDAAYSARKRTGTLAGFLESLTPDAGMTLENKFLDDTKDMIKPKTARSVFEWGMVVDGQKLGVWYDENLMNLYLCARVPEGDTRIYALTSTDHKVNYILAHSREAFISELVEAYRVGRLYFDSLATRRLFERRIAALYGVKL